MYQDVVEQIQSLANEVANEMHTAIPATVLSFDKQSGRATVRPKGKIKAPNDQYLDYPQLNDVPIVFPFCSALGAGMAFPIESGDSCLVIFSEQALDVWLGKGDTTSELKYSLTNAIAIPGLMKFAPDMLSEAINNKAVVLACGESRVQIASGGITLKGNVVIDGNLDISGTINK